MVTADTLLKEALTGELAGAEKFLDYGNARILRKKRLTLRPYMRSHGTCDRAIMCVGMDFLIERAAKEKVIFPLYPEEACSRDAQKKDAVLFAFPQEAPAPAVLVIAGGGFDYVCNVAEGFPIAMRFYRLGYSVFVLNYRVRRSPALAVALEDLACAVSRLTREKERFRISGGYALCGFSAGGTLAAQWGTRHLGAAAHGLEPPRALLLLYPALCVQELYASLRYRFFLHKLFGGSPSAALREQYDLIRHLKGFPPCFVAAGRNDLLIRPQITESFAAALRERGIPVQAELYRRAQHGFAEGTGTDAAGWIGRADAFLRGLPG